jgi:histidine triad (HIT) family protein
LADEQSAGEQEQLTQQCIFCKIASGELPSKKVYEDDKHLAVLDVNPVAPGHVLLMVKEHIPILAILDTEQMREIFLLAAQLAAAVREAMIVQRVSIACANGFAAGQRPPFHLLLHIIPREKGDGLDMLDLEKCDIPQADTMALAPALEQTTRQVFLHVGRDDLLKTHHIHKKTHEPPTPSSSSPLSSSLFSQPSPAQPSPPAPQESVSAEESGSTQEFSSTQAALEHVLAMSPDLRRFIMLQPDLVEGYIKRSPKLAKLFEGVDIAALSTMLREQEAWAGAAPGAAAGPVPASSSASSHEGSSPSSDGESAVDGAVTQSAKTMQESELFAFIDGNPGLRQWVLEHPRELAENLDKNPRLSALFEGVDILAIAKRYRAYLLRGGAQ